MLTADINILYRSDFYKIVRYSCNCTICSVSDAEFNDKFNISFIRKGFFEYRTFRRNEEAHTGRILVSKPGYEHTTRHIDNQPDVTTTFEFNRKFFKELCDRYKIETGFFLLNNDIHSLLLNSNPALEYFHHYILQKITSGESGSLEMDEYVLQLLEKVITIVNSKEIPVVLTDNLKKHHLATAEAAKEYMLQHFQENISLQQLSSHCHISAFHFSRVFKTIMNVSPYQFLALLRLNHAKILLETTRMPVTDIGYDCGFNSLEHFVTAYKKQFGTTPAVYRRQVA